MTVHPKKYFIKGLPDASQIDVQQIVPTIQGMVDAHTQALKEQLESLKQNNSEMSWENLVVPIDERDDELERYWSLISHLNSVKNSEEMREPYEQAEQILTQYGSFVGQYRPLFDAYEALSESEQFSTLTLAQQQAVHNALRNFRLAGVNLPTGKAEKFKAVKAKLASLTTNFSNNVLDATQAWSLHIEDESRLKGIPEVSQALMRAAAKAKQKEGALITLDIPVYLAVMTYADDRRLRETIYKAYVTRASEQGEHKAEFDNSALMIQIHSARQELADLLGFQNYAELSLARKMASSAAEIESFLLDLAEKSKEQAYADYVALKDFAKSEGVENFEPWDASYYSEKLRQEKYNISQEYLREFFPVHKVMSGLFDITTRLYDVAIEEKTPPSIWHEDAKYYEISRGDKVIAGFYFDMFARDGKRGGAWMADAISRRKTAKGDIQLPVAFLNCNFAGPSADKPALLNHSEVTTLFHEFGHGLHHMMTEIDVPAVSGISGVEWDAVELPSQFMENYCWDAEALTLMSEHYETGKPLPKEDIEKLLKAKNFQSAMQMLRQIEFALFDLRLHQQETMKSAEDIQLLLDRVREEVAVVHTPEYNRFQHGFTHIFAGGYAAGYYSYKWAEVLSSDAFEEFEKHGVFDTTTSQKFLTRLLSQGGSRPAKELFVDFKGREPKADALLRHSGITGSVAA